MFTSLSTYGYIILFLYSLGGGMVAIIAAGVLSYSGQMDLTVSIVVAAVANTLGDTLLFYMSRYNRADMMPYILKHRRKIALSHILMKRYGDKIIFFQKFLYGIKTLIPLAIGLTKYSFARFNVLNAISAFIWAVILGLASYQAGGPLIRFVGYIGENPWVMPLIVGGLLGAIWLYFQTATRKKRN
jgi:membrane protein DedA with SNARE-associated domain